MALLCSTVSGYCLSVTWGEQSLFAVSTLSPSVNWFCSLPFTHILDLETPGLALHLSHILFDGSHCQGHSFELTVLRTQESIIGKFLKPPKLPRHLFLTSPPKKPTKQTKKQQQTPQKTKPLSIMKDTEGN